MKEQHEQESTRLTKAEDELDSLREGNSKLAELRSKAKEADSLKTELAAVQRQLSQAQQAAKGPARRQSGATPDISEQLASKTSTIESLELDMSNLRNKITTLETTISERDASIKDLGDRVEASDAATDSAKKELDALKVSIAFPSDETKAANEDPEALTKRITVLESDLRSANSNLEAAAQRASSLEQKIEALTKLHKETTAASQGKDKVSRHCGVSCSTVSKGGSIWTPYHISIIPQPWLTIISGTKRPPLPTQTPLAPVSRPRHFRLRPR